MQRLLLILLVGAAVLYTAIERLQPQRPSVASGAAVDSDELQRAFADHSSNVQVRATGTVERILPDDEHGSRHQRFIVRLASGHTVLIAHNIDLAPRVTPLREGDQIEFRGEYEWNEQGGVVHWTHGDPAGRRLGGWLEHRGRRYQ